MILPIFILLVAGPTDPALLAPGPEELDAAFERTEWLTARAEVIERALSRIHNRWAAVKVSCEDAEVRSLAAAAAGRLRRAR